MKKLIPVIFCLLVVSQLSAQVSQVVGAANYNFFNGAATLLTDSSAYTYNTNQPSDGIWYNKPFGTQINWLYNNVGGSFVNNYMYQQTFNAGNKITSNTLQTWNGTAWVDSIQNQWMYDNNSNDTMLTSLTWNINQSQWVPQIVEHRTFTNNLLTDEVDQSYDALNQVYTDTFHQVYTYNPNNSVADLTVQTYDVGGSKWVNYARQLFNYNTLGFDTAVVLQQWNSGWRDYLKEDYYYNPDTTVALSVYSFYSFSWQAVAKDTFIYDANKNMISHVGYGTGNHGYDTAGADIYTYNAYNQCTFAKNFTYNNGLVATGESFYYYKLYTGVNDVAAEQNNLRLYPNPSGDVVHVNATLPAEGPVDVLVYNAMGQRVYQLHMGQAKSIAAMVPVNQLPAGLYTLSVQQGNYTQSSKLTVVR